MIQFFKKNDAVNFLVLLPYILIIRMYSFIYPQVYQLSEDPGRLNEWIFNTLLNNAYAQSIVAAIIIYVQAILINVEINNNKLFNYQCGYSGLLYAFLTSFVPGLQVLSPALIGMTFVLLASFSVYKVYKKNNATTSIFNGAIFIAIATLFYPPYLLVGFALFIEISILRSFKMKERLQYLVGFFVIFWIVGAFFFYIDSFSFEVWNKISFTEAISGLVKMWSSLSQYLIASIVIVLFVAGNYFGYMKKKGIESRKKIDFLFLVIVAGVISLFMFINIDYSHFIFLAFPIAVLLSMNLSALKNMAQAELAHIMILLAVFLSLYHDILGIF